MSAPYTDEKHPDVVYQVIPVVESVEFVKPQRPLWRRFIRIFMAFIGVSMIWSAVAPTVHYSCHHGHKKHHEQSNLANPIVSVGPDPNVPTQHFSFDHALSSFWIKQESFSAVPTRTEVVGTIYIHSCSKAENISAHFHVDASDDDILNSVEITAKKDGLLIRADPFSLVKQTVNVTGHIVIPTADDYQLKKLYVKTVGLPVVITKSFNTRNNATIVKTVSGSVAVLGNGNDGQLENVNNLKIKTVSGNIAGYFRIYHALALETTSGDIKASLYSEKRDNKAAWLKTENVSGNTTAIFLGDLTPRPLFSKHTSVSGDIQLVYPQDWAGAVKLETTSGKLSVFGKDTKIIKKEKDITKRLWEVAKGKGVSKGYVGSVSGDIKIQLGEAEED